MACTGNCNQGRDCRCRLITTDGGAFIDTSAECKPAPLSVLASPVVILAGGAFSLLCWAVLGLYLLR